MNMVESLMRKLREHAYRFAGLEEVTVPSAFADDAEIEHSNDMRYLKELLADIERDFAVLWRRVQDAPTSQDVMWLWWLQNNARYWPERTFEFTYPGSDVEVALLKVAAEIAAWGAELREAA